MGEKEEIIEQIRKIAKRNGKAPGRQLFQSETGIKESEWYGKIFRTWSEALIEAGYEPNQKQRRLTEDELLRAFAELTLKLNRIPASIDVEMESRGNDKIPANSTYFKRFKSKELLLTRLQHWIIKNPNYERVQNFIPNLKSQTTTSNDESHDGFVYLLTSGKFHKIGHSKNLTRRVREISIALPEEVEITHSIRTDDRTGIESYWHRRFAEKRVNGEWFKLSKADIRAFKRRKFQ